MQALAAAVPALVGGSADLAPSTKTLINDRWQYTERGDFADAISISAYVNMAWAPS
jgi:transketolase